VIDALGAGIDWEVVDAGVDVMEEKGTPLPPEVIESIRRNGVALKGPITTPIGKGFRSVNVALRQELGLYACLRPCKYYPGIRSKYENVDIVIVRENTEGEYSGVGGRVHIGTPYEVAVQSNIFTRTGTERIMRYAFDLARARNKSKSVVSVTKSNACNYSMVFWDEVFREVARDYPDVETHQVHVDAASMYLITKPEWFDVIVATNLFGDILTDEGAAIQGSIGLAAGANLNPERRYPSMFEPIHGSAPDIAGRGIANPIAMIWSVSMMLDFLGHPELGKLVMQAIECTLSDCKAPRPTDLGGTASTSQVGDAVCERLLALK